MDFITSLAKCNKFSTIFVAVDRLTKYAHFFPLSHPYSAFQVAKIFFDEIYKLHGLLRSIVSDRNSIFTSKFRFELFKIQGCSLALSSSYRPQSDRQSEITNKALKCCLRCFCSHKPHEWVRWLSLAEFFVQSDMEITNTMHTFSSCIWQRTSYTIILYF